MNILIRADANVQIGTGHLMRCAALGMKLILHGASVHFVCIELPEQLAEWLIKNGFGLTVLPGIHSEEWRSDLVATIKVAKQINKIDLLVVDHYQLDLNWESGMRTYVKRILVIDDLANRIHDCDILLDQNLHKNANSRYQRLIPSYTKLFLGPQYALLRPEFFEPTRTRNRDGSIKELLVFFGGADSGNQIIKVITAISQLGKLIPKCTFVLGNSYPNRDAIQRSASHLSNVLLLDSTDCMSKLMTEADLAIGTCGIAAWERCLLGLPCLVVITAENQREDAEILHQLGAVENYGDADDMSALDWEWAIRKAVNNPQRVCQMGLAAKKVMAGRITAIAELERNLLDDLR